MDILDNIIKSVYIAAISFLLYKTDFVVYYLRLFGLDKVFNLWDYCFYSNNKENKTSFLEYLKIIKPNFFTALIGCPYCLGFWITAIFCSFKIDLFFCYYVYVLLYKIITKI